MSIEQGAKPLPAVSIAAVGTMSFTLKAILIGLLALLLGVPLILIYATISERQGRYDEAVREIGNAWGQPQSIGGPALSVPYVTEEQKQGGGTYWQQHEATILPDTLTVAAVVRPELRYRGLFQAVVYVVDLDLSGEFVVPGLDEAARRGRIDWAGSFLRMDFSDARNIVFDGAAKLGGRDLTLEPRDSSPRFGTRLAALLGADTAPAPGKRLPFHLKLSLNGSERLSFLPLGKATSVSVTAPWASPSFFGAFLPGERQINDDGFTARWQVSYLGRGFPQQWYDGGAYDNAVAMSAFGVNFLQTVSPYRETERAVKYGILFVALTFAIYLLFEIASRRPIHLLQYAAVGLSLCVFYLLLLSLSEQLGFGMAYAISAAAVVGQTSAYTYATTRRTRYALAFGALLTGLYAFLFVLMQMESYSLLSGSIALFLALSALMYLTRNLNRPSQATVSPASSG